MLPFLAKKNDKSNQTGVIVKTRTPDEQPEQDQDDPSAAINACSQALIDAVHSRNAQGVSDAIKDAFEILSSMPEDSMESNSYEAGENE